MDIVTVPSLAVDARMLALSGRRLTARQVLERRIVAHLCAHLKRAGWVVEHVDDGEESTMASGDVKTAMEAIFAVDEAWITFMRPTQDHHRVFLVLGNGEDIISDWSYTGGDADGFNRAMDDFLSRIGEAF